MRWIVKLNSYTEISKSGTGVKTWVRGKLPAAIKHKREGEHVGIEVYSRQRFFWFTGNHLASTPEVIHDAQVVLEEIAHELRPAPKTKADHTERKVSPGERAAERMSGE